MRRLVLGLVVSLASALDELERVEMRAGRRLADDLAELRRVLIRAIAVQGGPRLARPDEAGDDGHVTEMLSIERTAQALDTSTSTVKRLIRTGALPAVRITPSQRRIRTTDLAAYVASLRPEESACPAASRSDVA